MRVSRLVALIAGTLAGPAALSAQTTIDSPAGSSSHSWGGFTNGFYLAQSFRAPNPLDVFLASFTVRQVRVTSGQPTTYRAFLATWDPSTRLRGTELWSSTGSDLSTALSDLAFNVGYQLLSDADYLFGLFVDAADGGNLFGNSYGDGHVLIQSGGLETNPWGGYTQYDLAFTADFAAPPTSAVPEPISMVLLGTGLVGIGAARRRRRQPPM